MYHQLHIHVVSSLHILQFRDFVLVDSYYQGGLCVVGITCSSAQQSYIDDTPQSITYSKITRLARLDYHVLLSSSKLTLLFRYTCLHCCVKFD